MSLCCQGEVCVYGCSRRLVLMVSVLCLQEEVQYSLEGEVSSSAISKSYTVGNLIRNYTIYIYIYSDGSMID